VRTSAQVPTAAATEAHGLVWLSLDPTADRAVPLTTFVVVLFIYRRMAGDRRITGMRAAGTGGARARTGGSLLVSGGTAEGQRHILESYGVTEDYVGVPIRASMEVASLGETSEGFPVVMDRYAAEADHVMTAAVLFWPCAHEHDASPAMLSGQILTRPRRTGQESSTTLRSE